MISLMAFSVLIAAAVGYLIKWLLDRHESQYEITWKEYAICIVLITCVVVPVVMKTGWHIAQNNLVTFEEYWNGWELSAVRRDIPCSKDGPCSYEYDCDPYQCHPHDCNCTCTSQDKNGTCTSRSCDTCYDTCYHDCPYVTVESNFTVTTTLEDFTISPNRFPENPQAYRWDPDVRVPDHIIDRAGIGIPPFWADAKKRIEAGTPGPVCIRHAYENYILASDKSILKQYSGDIERFKAAGVLPMVQSGVHDFYLADKVSFVGWSPSDVAAWQDALRRLNAAFGSELQGDLHLVIVHTSKVALGDIDTYALALKAYWQNTKEFGRNAFSKNGVGIIIGTNDGATVAWARSFTGMPVGNELLLTSLNNNLKKLPLTPQSVIGTVKGEFFSKGDKASGTWQKDVRSLREGGAIAPLLWAETTKFKRVSMSGKGPDDVGSGFTYLKGEIQPTTSQRIWILVFVGFSCAMVWAVAVFVGARIGSFNRRYY